MVPNEAPQYTGIVHLLLHFRWMWVGLLVVDEESGVRFMKNLQPLLSQRGICFAFTEKMPKSTYLDEYYDMLSTWVQIYQVIMKSKANAVIVYGETKTMFCLRSLLHVGKMEDNTNTPVGKVWIITAQLDFTALTYQINSDMQVFQGSIAFTVHSNEVHGFKTFIQLINPLETNEDGFLKLFWAQTFRCLFPTSNTDQHISEACTGEEKLQNLPTSGFELSMTGHGYSVYNAVYAIAHALHAMYPSGHAAMVERGRLQLQNLQPWQVY